MSQLGVIGRILSKDCAAHGAFLSSVFGWPTTFDFAHPDHADKVFHRTLSANGRTLIIDDKSVDLALPEAERNDGETLLALHVNHSDPEALEKKIISLGGTSVLPVAKQFWGSTFGVVRDVEGIMWGLSGISGEAEEFPAMSVVPYLSVEEPEKYVAFLTEAFGAKLEGDVFKQGDAWMHADVAISGSHLYLSSLSMDNMCEGDQNKAEPSTGEKRKLDDNDNDNDNNNNNNDEEKNKDKAEGKKLLKARVACLNLEVGPGKAAEIEALAIKHGAVSRTKVGKQFWGDVYGDFYDPFGVRWGVAEPKPAPPKAEIEANAAVGLKVGWENAVPMTITEVPKWRLLCAPKDNVSMAGLKPYFGDVMPRTARTAGKDIVGPPVAAYRRTYLKEGAEFGALPEGFDVSAGFPVSETFALDEGEKKKNDDDGDEGDALPPLEICAFGGEKRAIHATHVGPYENLPKTYKCLCEFAKEMGLSVGHPFYEIYVNDPTSVKPEELKTEIYLGIEEK